MKYLKLYEEWDQKYAKTLGVNPKSKIVRIFEEIKENFDIEKIRYKRSPIIQGNCTTDIRYDLESFHIIYYESKGMERPIIDLYINGKQPSTSKNFDYKVYSFFEKKIKEFQTYKFQKEYLTKNPDKLEVLEQFGFAEGIKEEFPALFRGKEWGFFDLERSER